MRTGDEALAHYCPVLKLPRFLCVAFSHVFVLMTDCPSFRFPHQLAESIGLHLNHLLICDLLLLVLLPIGELTLWRQRSSVEYVAEPTLARLLFF